jgi:hypothetical protein
MKKVISSQHSQDSKSRPTTRRLGHVRNAASLQSSMGSGCRYYRLDVRLPSRLSRELAEYQKQINSRSIGKISKSTIVVGILERFFEPPELEDSSMPIPETDE